MNKKTATLFTTTVSILIGTLLAAVLVGSINAAPLPQAAPTATALATDVATTATALVSPTSLTTATALVSPTTLATDTALTPVATIAATTVATTTSPSTLPTTGGSDSNIWLFVAIAGIALLIGAILLVSNRQDPSNS